MAQEELENIVQQMMAAGQSDEQIDAAVHAYDASHQSLNDKANDLNAQPGVPAPMGTPGVMGTLGVAAQNANRVRPALALAGKAVTAAANFPAAIGGTIGASAGAALGNKFDALGGPVVGAMGGATLGATAGRSVGRKLAVPMAAAGRGIERAFSLNTPRATIEEALAADSKATKAASYAKKVMKLAPRSAIAKEAELAAETAAKAIPKVGAALKFSPARKVVNTVASRILPGVGTALMVADAANTGYKVGGYLDEHTRPGGRKPSDWVGRTLAPLFGGSSKDYDAMVAALAEAEAKNGH